MENYNIQNNISNNIDNDKDINKDILNKEEFTKNSEKDSENQKIEDEKKEIKYRLNFSVIINHLRTISDIAYNSIEVEFNSNLLLMSSELNQSNKISCLTLISYVNHQKNNALYIYYLNKKIFKYLQIQKGIESFIYIRTLYRAAYFLEKDKNYLYAHKYINEAQQLSKNSKINQESKELLNKLIKKINYGLSDYLDIYIKKYRDIESEENLNQEKYNKLKKLMNDIKENKYEIKNNESDNTNEYLYVINKAWFNKAYNFIKDYGNVRDNNIKMSYYRKAFDPKNFYNNYFNEETKEINSSKNNEKKEDVCPFPGIIDNYSISDWRDYWNDPLNEDENNYIQQNLENNKDYYLLEKNDFEFLQNFFGVTNIIKRKKDCLDFVIIKAIIFDKRFGAEENSFLLRRRNLQIRINSKISDFKEKIIRCVEDSLSKIAEEKNKNYDVKNDNIQKNSSKDDIKKDNIKKETTKKDSKKDGNR